MATAIELTTHLDCSAEEVWAHVQNSGLLSHIAAPLIRFVPKDAPFPLQWEAGEYRAWMLLFGFLPIGWQAIVISHPEPVGDKRYLRDNGYGPLIKTWDHWIEISPSGAGEGTIYTDRVMIEAGVLTPLVAAFARLFYSHRQRRWRALVKSGFQTLRA